MTDYRLFCLVLGGACALLVPLCMRLTPRKGVLRFCERMFIGVAVVFLVSLVAAPFGVKIAQSPLSAMAAGFLGVPGAVLAACLQAM